MQIKLIKAVGLILSFGLMVSSANAQGQKPELYIQTGHSQFISSISFSSDGRIIVSGSADGTVKIWNAKTGAELLTLPRKTNEDGSVVAAISPDGHYIASADISGVIKLWNTETGENLWTQRHENRITSVIFSPDGQTLASASYDDMVKLWDIKTGKELRTLRGHTGIVNSVTFSSNGQMLVSGSEDNTIKLWSVKNGKVLRTFRGHAKPVKSVAFSAQDKVIISGSTDQTIKIWETETAQEIRTINAHNSGVSSVAFSPVENIFVSASFDRKIKTWDAKTGRNLLIVNAPESVVSAVFSPDGKTIAFGGFGKTIELRNAKTGEKIQNLRSHTDNLSELEISPNGEIIASESENKTIKLWNVKTGKQLMTLRGHTDIVRTIAFSENSGMIASGGFDNTVKIWDVRTGQELRTLIGHTNYVYLVAFSPDGSIVASGSFDRTIKLWNTATGELIESFQGDDNPETKRKVSAVVPSFYIKHQNLLLNGKFQVRNDRNKLNLYETKGGKIVCSLVAFDKDDWAVITPDGYFDGTPNAWKFLFWRLSKQLYSIASVEAFFKEFYRPGLLQDIINGVPIESPTQELSEIDIRQPSILISEVDGKTVNSSALSPDEVSDNKRTVKVEVEITDNISEPRPGIAKNSSSDARDVRLFRNGSLVKLWSGNAFKLTEKEGCRQISKTADFPRKAVCETDVRISAGKNELTVYGFNRENVKSSDNTAIITGADSLKQDGTLYVLAIGVNKYANAKYNLNYAVKDVTEIGRTLQQQQAKIGNLKQYAETEIVTLTDELATKENILNALKLFAGDESAPPETASEKLKAELSKIKPTQPEDALLIYYAGHGVSRKQRFYLIPHNFTGDPVQFEKETVSDLELNDSLEKVDAGKLLMVIDACQSGQALGGKNDGKAPMNSKGFAQLAYDKGMYILTAAQSQQAALEAVRIGDKNIENGLLTYTLLQAFGNDQADKDANKQLWETEWFDFAVEQVPLFQREAMKQRSLDLKNNSAAVKGRSELAYIEHEEGLPPEARNVQMPRVFYRRETDNRYLVVANQQNK